MKVETKFDLGQRIFYINEHNNQFEVLLGEIRQINFGGKAWDKYEVAWNKTRSENEIYTSFKEAHAKAIKDQEALNAVLIKRITDQKEPLTL